MALCQITLRFKGSQTLRHLTCAGFGSYIFGMSTVGYNLAGGDLTDGNRLTDTYVLSTGRIIGYGLCIVFIGEPPNSLTGCWNCDMLYSSSFRAHQLRSAPLRILDCHIGC